MEGPQAVREAVPFLQRLFVTPTAGTEHADLVAAARAGGTELVTVSDEILAELVTTVTPQGLVGVAAVEPPALETLVADAQLLVVLHQVRDPGNAGTAIRTADAAGADGVVLTSGSVDAHNPQAVRSSAGSVFHLPVVADVGFSEFAGACRERGVRLVATAAGAPLVHTDADLIGPVALIFGNEAHGLGHNVLDSCDAVVRIPLSTTVREGYTGTAESLNLAASVAVMAFESARQQAALRRPVAHAATQAR